jgi:hypothetical protein
MNLKQIKRLILTTNLVARLSTVFAKHNMPASAGGVKRVVLESETEQYFARYWASADGQQEPREGLT